MAVPRSKSALWLRNLNQMRGGIRQNTDLGAGPCEGLFQIIDQVVRLFDPDTGDVHLSDRSRERLDVATLRTSPRDGALLCTVKRELVPDGLPARFLHAAHAELMNAVTEDGAGLRIRGGVESLPSL